MTTDPKKNDEIMDEELERVAGGAGSDKTDEQPDGGGVIEPPPPAASQGGSGANLSGWDRKGVSTPLH